MMDDVDVRIMHNGRCTAVEETPGGGSVRQSVIEDKTTHSSIASR